ncbi:hypothetical protein TWF106_004131 [Orbilia oligospora]|uniref:Uncharacterized protein n=1 Tax=Orbilia oligospora TaxID=2813651 RepID=A0A6G1M1D1_ORBOL|nr:hypothetical protein TWF106_004131 [Orbilia oligospora]KAF3212673.1 hypothetical protein TWF191_010418 [Orbilia oligospora]KAF3240857.1 hypothetical protein TWF192_009321 [Orbilia oligospora]
MLRSSTAKVWLEKCTDPPGSKTKGPPTRGSKYKKTAIYLPSKSTQRSSPSTHPKPITFKTNEAFVESSPETYYRIKLSIPRHLKSYCVQIIIDGVEQNTYVETSRYFRTVKYPISARRTRKYTYRHFQFSKLSVKDSAPGVGDYVFNDSQHCENGYMGCFKASGDIKLIDYMVGKKAVGTIRVNFYKIRKCRKMTPDENKKVDGRDDGDGEWEPCQAVDNIGALKLGAGVENVTTLGPEVRGSEPGVWYHVQLGTWHPFETFVFKYRPYSVLKENNLLVLKPTRFQKFTRFIKKIFSFSKKSKKSNELEGSDEKFNEKVISV